MNKKAKEFLEALRTTKQGKDQLVYDDRFCCLGVMCKTLGYAHDMESFTIDGHVYTLYPPPKVYKELGLKIHIDSVYNTPMIYIDFDHPNLKEKAPIFSGTHKNKKGVLPIDLANEMNDRGVPFTEIKWLLETFGEWE